MNQRLCIEITEKGKPLANAMYNYSGYTLTGLMLAESLIENAKTVEFDDRVFNAMVLLKLMDAYHWRETVSRSDADDMQADRMAVTEKGMKLNRRNCKVKVEIDLALKVISLEGLCTYSKSEYESMRKIFPYEQLPICTFDFKKIPFSKLGRVMDICRTIYFRRKGEEDIYSFIAI